MLWDFPLLMSALSSVISYLSSTLPGYGFGGTSRKTFHLRGSWHGLKLVNKLGQKLRPATSARIVKKLSKKSGK